MNFINIIISYCFDHNFINNLFNNNKNNKYKETNINEYYEEEQQNNTSHNFFIKISMNSINALYSLINNNSHKSNTNNKSNNKIYKINNKIHKINDNFNQNKKYEHTYLTISCFQCNINIDSDKEIFCLYDNIFCSTLCRNKYELPENYNALINTNGKRKKY